MTKTLTTLTIHTNT